MKKVFGLFFSLIVLMGSSACNQKELDNLQSQIDELKSVQIASINVQIAGIQSSIESMEKIDKQLKARIDELTKKQQELESTDAEQAKEIAALKESLIEKEASLSKRIDELKSYVEEELKTQKDWVSATFSTLEQYQSTCDEIAALKLAISAQETTLRELISTTESSIKTWVNEQLSGYYTIAEMDAKIAQLSKSIVDGDAAQATELEKLRAELNAARTDIKTAYEKAIEDAITTSEGKINEKIARDIKSATDALQSQIDELNTKIADIEKRLGLVEASLEKILSQVQSIVVVPTYSDGTVGIKESEDTEIRFEVSPRSASVALANQGPEVFSLDAVSTQTKASMFVANFPIKSVSDNGECLVVRLDAAKMDMAAVYANPSMSARLRIDDGNNSMTTNYFKISVERSYDISFETLGTKAIQSDNGTVWKAGDKVFLSDGKASIVCTIPDEFDGMKTATVRTWQAFSGKVTCIYPGDCVTKEGTDFYVDVPEKQGEDGRAYAVYSGSSLSKDIQLSAQTALLKVSFKPEIEDIDSVRVAFEGANIVGRMKIGQTGTKVVSGAQSVEVTAKDAKEFYFSVIPGTVSTVDVDVCKTDGVSARMTHSLPMTFEAGRVYDLRIDASNYTVTREYKGLTFVSTGESTVSLRKYDNPRSITLEYSKNGFTWTPYTIGNSISLSDGEKLMFRAGKDGNVFFSSSGSSYYNFKISGSVAARGNIMSLLDRSCALNSVPNFAFNSLFKNCKSLTSAPDLPATELADGCYRSMFEDCTNLTKAPDLPATKLAYDCYYSMFAGCTSLTEAPALPATKLAANCYFQMFEVCTGLTKAPALPAMELASQCYWNMFSGCSSLIEAPALPATELAVGCYCGMFSGCTSLTETPVLPAIVLSECCYGGMFSGCTSLTKAPELPATKMADECYSNMFADCTSLTKAPELPATKLAYDCYSNMFYGCTSLTEAPELPATELAEKCYKFMFHGCTSLTKAPELPAMKLVEECYYYMFWGCTDLTEAPSLPATELARYCYFQMFEVCTGLTKAPALPAMELAEGCYEEMFWGCTSLTEAPELPAIKLAKRCYFHMFFGCTSLNYVKALFTDEPSEITTGDWLYGVAPTGTFVKNKNATWDVRGDDGIPKGWTVVTE